MNAHVDVRLLLGLIRDLDFSADARTSSELEYVEVMRWNADGHEGGNRDDEACALFRRLLRQELGKVPVGEIGAAVLASLDAAEPQS